jgi:hypothetical protein
MPGDHPPFCDRYYHRTLKLEESSGSDPAPGNIFMNIRFVLYKIGANPDLIEIDEAIPLVDLYHEDRAAFLCPLLEIT